MSNRAVLETPAKNDRKEIFGWLMYDWANSAFYTTVISVLLGPYLTALAQADVGQEGVIFSLGWLGVIKAETLFPFAIGISVVAQVVFLPLLGSIADYTHLKKKMMAVFCYLGVLSSSLLFFITGDNYLLGYVLMIVANMSFAASNVFYNAFLIDLTTEDQRNKISSYGFAAGYLGGIIMLAFNIGLIQYADTLGLEKAMAVRISMLAASLWWGAFGLVTFLMVRSRNAAKQIPDGKKILVIGFSELWETIKELFRLKYTALFLLAYLFYNDGIQTVILMSSTFLSQELFVRNGLETDEAFLLGIFMLAQFTALVGAIVFERIARLIGAKWTVVISLAIWCGIVFFAYAYLDTRAQAWAMGAFIGLVLGSSQALSRSLYSQMIPKERESGFFGLYEISEKGTSWLGVLVFGLVVTYTGSYRQAILGIIFFFAVGIVLLVVTNTARAIHEAGNLTPEEAAGEPGAVEFQDA
ncbi:MAG: MFS transporter [Acidobacteria bacterium]|nr:MAG: MFS transporter [Acidobacteriota bacterium]REK01515.1 MAG: MFS transporter [Acidobacteriota bacterium]REK14471.1 MAG: MFS transporter [Acidobacteriota bacterium]REK45186.1 MAG: MFS transporter [Acidobacteriota bacterium]